MSKVQIYDTTLRDGVQGEGITFSVEEKIKISKRLNRLGVDYIEGGWPASNPKDMEFFKKIKNVGFKTTRIVAFGSTRRTKYKVEDDPNIKSLLEAETASVCIFGKSWDLHVEEVLCISMDENLELIKDSIEYLKKHGKEVIYDAEHFFDGYKSNSKYAIETLKVAEAAGADIIVLCDTNGGSMPYEVEDIIKAVKKEISVPLGIHAHNDAGMAVANSVVAVRVGCTHVQGTINGYGERCGNADLCCVIPNLKFKLNMDCISDDQLRSLTELSRFVSETANVTPSLHQPYVGLSAFAHKGGVHIDGMRKTSLAYEHIDPSLVGNERKILLSELSGQSTIISKALEHKINLKKNSPQTLKILEKIKTLEEKGYQFEGADASFVLLVKKITGEYRPLFTVKGFRVIIEKRKETGLTSEATVKLEIDGHEEYTVAEGDGPVNALDNALRKALNKYYPYLKEVHLTDYKVRVIDGKEGTAAKVRVLIESMDKTSSWGTVGVSENIIEASWHALLESMEYLILKKEGTKS